MKTYLVTGGAGFIGSHICLMLLQNKFSLYILDSYANSFPDSLDRVKLISNLDYEYIKDNISVFKGDLRDKNSIKKVFLDAKARGKTIDGVIHLAGLKSVSQSILNPLIYWENNVVGTLNLLKCLDLKKCKAFIFSSSATVYGVNNVSPISENFDTKPINPYGETKLIIEKILESIYNSEENSVNISNLRYFNPIGAHNTFKIGENPKGIPNNLFPFICKVALGQIDKLKIFNPGKKYQFLDKVFLRVLEKHPEKMPKIFFNMFKTSSDTVIKFLSNKSNLIDDVNIISKMPKLIFFKALFN